MSTRTIKHLVTALGLTAALASSAAADDFDSKREYPLEFVARPLVLHENMMEVRFGAASDFVAEQSADRLSTKADFVYSFAPRLQLGVTSILAAVPTDGFAVDDVAGFFEYSMMPSVDLRVGGYATAPRDADDELDGRYGVRFGLPMKWRTSPGSAIWFTPETSIGTENDRRVDAPLIGQVQLGSRLAFSMHTGLRLSAYEFTEETASMPLGAGVHIAGSRMFDITVQLGMTDVTEAAGRDDRWLLGFFSFRN